MTSLASAGGAGAIVVTSSTPVWYITRATGLMAIVLLTGTMALGLLSSVRFEASTWPRYITGALHRNIALVALVFTVLHVLTAVADTFTPISLADAVFPFVSAYRPFWLGLGTVAFDLMVALTVTSLVRTRLGYRPWRLVHWSVYLCWPVAVVHGLGTGTDTPARWVLGLTGACVALITGLIVWRLAQGWPANAGVRIGSALTLAVVLLAGLVWLANGPLQPGWSKRAGTPPPPAKAAAQTSASAGGKGTP
ncbi:MAG TPA: ferric reductase-like transmembrane domain-containing protein [Streptosporangiaceae bacterium]